jgi:hypothetical protein
VNDETNCRKPYPTRGTFVRLLQSHGVTGYPQSTMFRLSRRLTAALLWIAIALLPVRGLAAALMPLAMGGMQHDAVASLAMTDAAAVAVPCHAAVQDASDSSSSNAPSTCAMCDLCHTAAAHAAPVSVALPDQHGTLPHAAPSAAIEPRAPDGLFRPPRTHLV